MIDEFMVYHQADDDDLAFTCEEPHIMAIYNFASTVAFEFRFDKAKEMIVSLLPSVTY